MVSIMRNDIGRLERVWLPNGLYALTEQTRQRLGMSKSAFYRYAITRLLEEMSVLSTKAKEPNKIQPGDC
jgi:hypothetical protein